MRVAVVDIGTNSTRLLVAEVSDDGRIEELARRSVVTRLGDGVDSSGELSDVAAARVFAVLEEYRRLIEQHAVTERMALLTSAVRDASNGAEFARRVEQEYGLPARTLAGEEEAQLTFLGATSVRELKEDERLAVIDIGGGSTEFVIGSDHRAEFYVSTQSGVVRMSERHIHSDPPQPEELQALADDTRAVFAAGLPEAERRAVTHAIAVAGTATSLASIDQELDPYDAARVEGYALTLATCELLLARLAAMTDEVRRRVVGLDPDRAPTIVAGAILLVEALRLLGLEEAKVSEHDILYGGALRLAGVS